MLRSVSRMSDITNPRDKIGVKFFTLLKSHFHCPTHDCACSPCENGVIECSMSIVDWFARTTTTEANSFGFARQTKIEIMLPGVNHLVTGLMTPALMTKCSAITLTLVSWVLGSERGTRCSLLASIVTFQWPSRGQPNCLRNPSSR